MGWKERTGSRVNFEEEEEEREEELVKVEVEVEGGGGVVTLVGEAVCEVEVRLDVAQGFHIGCNPAEPSWGFATEVRVSEKCRGRVEVVRVTYPEPVRHGVPGDEDATGGYQGRGNRIVASVRNLQGTRGADTFDLEFEVHYQACEDQVCHRPAVARCSVPARVV